MNITERVAGGGGAGRGKIYPHPLLDHKIHNSFSQDKASLKERLFSFLFICCENWHPFLPYNHWTKENKEETMPHIKADWSAKRVYSSIWKVSKSQSSVACGWGWGWGVRETIAFQLKSTVCSCGIVFFLLLYYLEGSVGHLVDCLLLGLLWWPFRGRV